MSTHVCVSDMQEQGDGLTHGDREHPSLGEAASHPNYLHTHTFAETNKRTSTDPSVAPLAFWKQHCVPDTESVVSGAALFTQMLEVNVCDCACMCVGICVQKK